MSHTTFAWIGVLLFLLPQLSSAGQVRYLEKKERAYFTEAENGFYRGHHLVKKEVRYSAQDAQKCGSRLKRNTNTLTYFCIMNVPRAPKMSKLHKVHSPNNQRITYGRIKKNVQIEVAEDGKSIKYIVEFDEVGFDNDTFDFNTEFFAIYAKTAQTLIKKAMAKKTVILSTIESE